MPYRTGPSENTLTVNSTHQMLRHYEDNHSTGRDHLVAFSPNRRWENLCGYDVGLSFLKATVFQYKRPKVPARARGSTPMRRFSLSRSQWLTLLLLFDQGEAFFTLPEVMDVPELSHTMDRTVFIDVHGILPNTSLAYVPHRTAEGGDVRDFLLGKIRNGSKYPIHPEYVYGWQDISDGVEQCTIGLSVIDEERRTEAFSAFERRIGLVDDYAEIEAWLSRLDGIIDTQVGAYTDFFADVDEARREFPPEDVYGIDPLESQSWGAVSDVVPTPDDGGLRQGVEQLAQREWTNERIRQRIEELRDSESDPTTYRVRSSQVNLFGE